MFKTTLFVVASDCKKRGDPGFWIASSLLLLATTTYAKLSSEKGGFNRPLFLKEVFAQPRDYPFRARKLR
jgi:hypothetical protein